MSTPPHGQWTKAEILGGGGGRGLSESMDGTRGAILALDLVPKS